jgi:DNA-directed RNA polymerase subunit B
MNKKLISLDETTLKILTNIIDYNKILEQHILEPYNKFIDEVLNFYNKKVIDLYETNEEGKNIKYYIEISGPVLEAPKLTYANGEQIELTPIEAVIKGSSYLANLYASVKLFYVENDKVEQKFFVKNKKMGAIPVMRGSKIDPVPITNNLFGYFITKGTEKSILSLEEIVENTILSNKENDVTETYLYSSKDGFRYLNKIVISKKGIDYKFQPLNFSICLISLLRCIGATDADILALNEHPIIQLKIASYIETSAPDRTLEAILEVLSRQTSMPLDHTTPTKIKHMVMNYILLHLGNDESSVEVKKHFLLNLLKKAIRVHYNEEEVPEMDSYEYKKVKVPGTLLHELFIYNFNKQIEQFKTALIKNIFNRSLNLLSLLKADVLTNGFIAPIVSGTWIGGRQNLTTTLDRKNAYAYQSTVRKIVSPLLKSQQHIEARSIARNHRGRIDPVDCGHGSVIGLVKSLTLGAMVTEHHLINIDHYPKGDIPVFINGQLIHYTSSTKEFVEIFKKERRTKVIHKTVGINYNNEEIYLRTDKGRVVRVLYTNLVKKNKLNDLANLSLKEMEKQGYIEWIDAMEENMLCIAQNLDEMDPSKETHAEIHPCLLFGLTSVSIPFLNHTGAARISYGQKLFKQAIIAETEQQIYTPVTREFYIEDVQKPLVGTAIEKIVNNAINQKYTGLNLVIAIMPIGGWNLEDAVCLKRSAVERGLFNGYIAKTYTTETSEYLQSELNNFVVPKQDVDGVRAIEKYSLLEEDGLVANYSNVKRGDALIGAYRLPSYIKPSLSLSNESIYKDNSIYNQEEDATVKQVLISKTPNLTKIAHVTLISERRPIVGDKFTSRYAQKGVLGKLIDDWNMPYDQITGMAPDLIIAGSAYPTRYTFGHILEILTGKACAIECKYAEEFFSSTLEDIDKLYSLIESAGYIKTGEQELINPKTGIKYVYPIYMGVSYYLRLHHLVKEKMHVRSTGPIQLLTRQATEGRNQVGGLRLGEMERECLIGYGAANLVLERLNIDSTIQLVCSRCESLIDTLYNKAVSCHNCKTDLYVQRIKIPYAFKILMDELLALHIKIGIVLKKYE